MAAALLRWRVGFCDGCRTFRERGRGQGCVQSKAERRFSLTTLQCTRSIKQFASTARYISVEHFSCDACCTPYIAVYVQHFQAYNACICTCILRLQVLVYYVGTPYSPGNTSKFPACHGPLKPCFDRSICTLTAECRLLSDG